MQLIYYSNTLCHHGIKGQRWGRRRFQNADGSLTPLGRSRYGVDIDGATKRLETAKSAYNKRQSLANAKQLRYAKEDLKTEKIKVKLNKENKISKHRQKLEAHYRSKGMTDEEAAVAAYKRSRTEKIIGALAGATLAATAAYVAYKQYDKRVDKIIPSNVKLSRVASDSDSAVHDAFYAAYKKKDVKTYVGLFGKGKHQKTIGLTGDLKIASESKGLKVVSDLLKTDNDAKRDLISKIDSTIAIYGRQLSPKQVNELKLASRSLKNGKINKHVYNAVNFDLAGGVENNPIGKKLYEALKKQGYDGIRDINDKKLSGFNTKDPLIIFNKSKIGDISVRKLGDQEVNRVNREVLQSRAISSEVKGLAAIGASAMALINGGKGLSSLKSTKNNDEIVRKYKKAHPNTNLSYTEIVRKHG